MHKDVYVRSELTLWLEIVIISCVHFASDVNSREAGLQFSGKFCMVVVGHLS